MNFSKTTSYAITVLNYLARHQHERFSAKTLNEILEIPRQYLRHLLTTLSKEGFIESVHGRNGGFSLKKEPGEIFLADIIDAVEGLNVFSICIMGFKECPFDNKCAMHETWEDTKASIINILKTTSLETFNKAS